MTRSIRLPVALALLLGTTAHTLAAPVTGVFGSFGAGGWQSRVGAISTVVPNDSNLLLGFTTATGTYGTGVDDATLSTLPGGAGFTPVRFEAFTPGAIASGAATQPLIGIASNWGGVAQGATGFVPSNAGLPLAHFITNGTQGLTLNTGLFNIPASNLDFAVLLTSPTQIGGAPDILVTQIGDPSARSDVFSFRDAMGALVGNTITVAFVSVPAVGNQRFNFYNNSGPRAHAPSLAGNRPLRMQAFDLGDFGITAANMAQVASFRQALSGDADVAFVAYNHAALVLDPIDLAITASPMPAAACPTDKVNFDIVLRNTSAVDASDIEVHITLPPGFTLDAPPAGYDPVTQLWQVPSLLAGASVTLQLSATAGSQAGDLVATITAQANRDPDPANDTSTASVAQPANCTPPPTPAVNPVPMQQPWALGLLALLMGVGALRKRLFSRFFMRRRQPTQHA